MLKNTNVIGLHSDDFSILPTAKSFHQQLLSNIANAKQRIYIVALYLQEDEAGQSVLQALFDAKKSNPSLDVKVIVDHHRAIRGLIGEKAHGGNREWYQKIAQGYETPIDVLGVAIKPKELFGVLHLKGMVFDDEVLYSGASINNVYLHVGERYRLDRYFSLQSKSLADSIVNFINAAFILNGTHTDLLAPALPSKPEVTKLSKRTRRLVQKNRYQAKESERSSLAVTPLLGLGRRKNLLNQRIVQLIRSSQTNVCLYTPYFNLPRRLTKEVVNAMKRGVAITIVVGDKRANDFFIPEDKPFSFIGIVPYIYETILARFVKRYQSFIDKGLLDIRLWRHESNSFHLKGINVDHREYLLTGSNLNPRAWLLDIENGLLLEDKQGLLTQAFAQEHEAICQHTTLLRHFEQLESIDDYPEQPRRLIKRVKMAKVDRLLKRLL